MSDFRSKGMGWKPSPPDQRDYKLRVEVDAADLPTGVDLRSTGYLGPVWDQGNLGSCVAHGCGKGMVFDWAKQGTVVSDLSRLFVYYNGRVLEGTTNDDSGLYVRDGVKSLARWGAPPEEDWVYDIDQFDLHPPPKAYEDGLTRQALVYGQVQQNLDQMKAVLAAGFPIIVGFTVYESFYDGDVGGQVPMPGPNENVAGGHCVLVVGYGTDKFICLNSWGDGWGDHGYFYMPHQYLTDPDLADDFWVVKGVESVGPTPVPPVDFLSVANKTADAFHGIAPPGDLVFVRDIVRDGKLIERVWKQSGVEIFVKNLHP